MTSELTKCIVPILELTSNGEAGPIGSGILVRVAHERFLITAAHVADFNSTTGLYLPCGQKIKRIAGQGRCTVPPANGRKHDMCDSCFIRLNPDFADEVDQGFTFLSPDSIEMSDFTSDDDHYLISGFPSERQHYDPVLEFYMGRRNGFVSYPASKRIYRKCGCRRRSHIVLGNPTENFSDLEGNRAKTTSLECMSGGGVWKIEYPYFDEPYLSLVGIIIEHHKRWGVVVGVRINGVMEMIRETHPELSRFIPESSTLTIVPQDSDP
jgi:hypothetical protein